MDRSPQSACAAVGAGLGAIAGALMGMGVPEEHARYYEGEAKAGKTLVTVDHRDAAVRFWDVATGKVQRSFRCAEKGRQYGVCPACPMKSPNGKVCRYSFD